MRKILLITTFLVLSGLMGSALAQETELPEPGLTPDSPFYFLEEVAEEIGTFFTFGDVKKAERYATLATERIAEAKAMSDKGNSEAAEKALARYQKQLEKSLLRVEQAETQGKNIEEVAEMVAEATGKHLMVLEEVLEKVPEQARGAILQAREASMNGQKNALRALAKENPEKATEINLKAVENRLSRAKTKAEANETDEVEKSIKEFEDQNKFGEEISEIAQGNGKDTTASEQLTAKATSSHLEILSEIYEKVPEKAKPTIEKAMEVSAGSYKKTVGVLKEKEALNEISEEVPMPQNVPVEVKKRVQEGVGKETKEKSEKPEMTVPLIRPRE